MSSYCSCVLEIRPCADQADKELSLAREALVERFVALEEEGRNLSLEDAVGLAAEQRQVV